jgi:type VII secretion-associated serine protease mycosin
MKRYLSGALLLALLLWPSALSSQGQPGSAADPDSSRPDFRPGQVLVKFRPQTSHEDQAQLLAARDLPVLGQLPASQVQLVGVTLGQEQATAALLNQDPLVEFAELDYVVHATIIPNDYYFYRQWGLVKIQAPTAWDQSTGGPEVIIAVVDTGVDLNHPDLDDKIVPGWDFVNGDNLAQDDHGHGTHVAGIAAAETNNGQGVAGVSWGARLMPIKVLDESGDGYYSDVASGVRYACNHGAKIINLSLGGSNPSSTLKEALEDVSQKGCLVLAAAGNSGQDTVDYPARYAETIAVAATDRTDQRASFSDYGPEIDVAAPGVDIWSTLWPHTYDWKAGTSMSTPHVSGLAALVWSLCPDLSSEGVRGAIEGTAKDLGASGWDPYYGHGRIDAAAALEAAGPPPVLAVDKDQLLFLADATWGPWPQTLLVSNAAPCRRLEWSAEASEDWLDAYPGAGQASSSHPAGVTISVDESGLVPGETYNAPVTVSSTTLGVLESPRQVSVKFVYSDTPLNRTFYPLGMSH